MTHSAVIPDPSARTRRAAYYLLASAALTLAWVCFAEWVFPALLSAAYRGEGFAFLGQAMGNRGEIPLSEYLAQWRVLSTRVLAWIAGAALFGGLWVARGESLEHHWFAPARLRDLGIARIAIVGMQLFVLFFSESMTPDYQASIAGADPALYEPMEVLRLMLLPITGGARPDAELLRAVWLVGAISAACGTLGLLTRPALLALAWSSTVLTAHSYSYGEFHHPEALQTIALWALALAPSGGALSLDRAIAQRWRGAAAGSGPVLGDFARWPLRLVQWMLALTYFAAGVAKLMNGGVAWFAPSTLSYYFAHDGLRDGFPLGVWLSEHPWLLPPQAVFAVGFELTFPLVLVLPRLAPAFVLAAIGLHVGVYVVHGPPFFQHLTLLIAFLEPVRQALRGDGAGALRVVYDGRCGLCQRTRALLERLDLSRRLAFVDLESQWAEIAPALGGVTQDEARHAMRALDAQGRVHAGFFAFRRIAAALPLLWPLAPLLWLPPAGWLGPRVYAAIASRRRRLACASGQCALPPQREATPPVAAARQAAAD